MAGSKKSAGKKVAPVAEAAPVTSATAAASVWSDGYEGLDWELYARVRPHTPHSGATGAGLVEYTLWLEVIEQRPAGNRHEVPLPGQPVN